MNPVTTWLPVTLPHGELILRLAIAAGLGGIIGLERELHGRPAGFRTHLVVGMASALFMIVSTQFPYIQRYYKDLPLAVDTSRIAASVVSGIGFIGAGAIMRTGLSVQGLTTAAVLWLDAAIGLAIGGGLYVEGTVTTGFAVVALVVLRRLEVKAATMERLAVSFRVPQEKEGESRRLLAIGGRKVLPIEISDSREGDLVNVSLEVSGNEMLTVDDVRTVLRGVDGLRDLKVQRVGR